MIRSYTNDDYETVKELYGNTEWYGGVYDEARDGRARLASVIAADRDAILVYEREGRVIATISIIENGRIAMLYRFVVPHNDSVVAKELYIAATKILADRGHTQVLVYSSVDSAPLDERYSELGMNKGSNYSCFWADL